MDGITFFVIAAIWVVFAISATVWNVVKSRKRVDRWASDNGYTLQRCEWLFLSASPFRVGWLWYRKGGFEVVWTIRVVGPEKVQKDGWIQCGSTCLGMLSDRVEVAWTKPGESAF